MDCLIQVNVRSFENSSSKRKCRMWWECDPQSRRRFLKRETGFNVNKNKSKLGNVTRQSQSLCKCESTPAVDGNIILTDLNKKELFTMNQDFWKVLLLS